MICDGFLQATVEIMHIQSPCIDAGTCENTLRVCLHQHEDIPPKLM